MARRQGRKELKAPGGEVYVDQQKAVKESNKAL